MNVLQDFYYSLDGPNWRRKWDLNNKNCCGWSGVSCNIPGIISSLSLENNYLMGIFSQSIGNLTNLTLLDVSLNNIESSIPSCMSFFFLSRLFFFLF